MKLLLPKRVIFELRSLAFDSNGKHEVGGIILGLRREAGIEIISITKPKKSDFSSPSRFIRNPKGHKDIAIREWKKSNQTIDYIGEWHSHPIGSSLPSCIDLANWKKIAKITAKDMVHVIIGRKEFTICTCSRTGEVETLKEILLESASPCFLFSSKK